MRSWDLEMQMKQEIAAACEPIAEAIRQQWAPRIAEAKAKEEEQQRDYLEYAYQEALKKAWWPLGTKVVQWTNREGQFSRPWRQTGLTGFYELCDARGENTIPAMKHAEYFVRLANKDGKAGKRAAYIHHWYWFPEGEHPSTYEHPSKRQEAERIPL